MQRVSFYQERKVDKRIKTLFFAMVPFAGIHTDSDMIDETPDSDSRSMFHGHQTVVVMPTG